MASHDEYEDPPVEVVSGSVQGSAGADLLSEDLLNAMQMTTRISVLLAEADEDDFRAVRPRLMAFLSMVQALPTTPRPRRRVGFHPKAKGRGKR